jgi:hypothetical protein
MSCRLDAFMQQLGVGLCRPWRSLPGTHVWNLGQHLADLHRSTMPRSRCPSCATMADSV